MSNVAVDKLSNRMATVFNDNTADVKISPSVKTGTEKTKKFR